MLAGTPDIESHGGGACTIFAADHCNVSKIDWATNGHQTEQTCPAEDELELDELELDELDADGQAGLGYDTVGAGP